MIIITNRIGTSWTLEADTSTPIPTTASYFESEKIYYDNDGAIRTAEAKGKAEGRAEVARNLLSMGMSIEDIAQATGMTEEEVASL